MIRVRAWFDDKGHAGILFNREHNPSGLGNDHLFTHALENEL
jgi:hypothetical protein